MNIEADNFIFNEIMKEQSDASFAEDKQDEERHEQRDHDCHASLEDGCSACELNK